MEEFILLNPFRYSQIDRTAEDIKASKNRKDILEENIELLTLALETFAEHPSVLREFKKKIGLALKQDETASNYNVLNHTTI